MPVKIMILGANGFIGSALTNAILASRPWEVYGIDLADHKLDDLLTKLSGQALGEKTLSPERAKLSRG